MNATERRGLYVVAGVVVYIVIGFVVFQVSTLVAAANAPRADWSDLVARLAVGTGILLVGLTLWGNALWAGQSAARWLGAIAVAGFGAVMIGLGIWMTTLDYPNAPPDERVTMQESDRRELPWRIGQGVVHMLVGAALFLPPVGSFLRYRRRVQGRHYEPEA